MVAPTTQRMFVEQLQLQNYRCFGQLTVDFDPKLTVLVAPNGGGKSAVLSALATGLGFFRIEENSVRHSMPTWTDIRLRKASSGQMEPAGSARLTVNAQVFGHQREWSSSRQFVPTNPRASTGGGSQLPDLEWLRSVAIKHGDEGDQDSTLLPLMAYYTTSRQWGNNAAYLLNSEDPEQQQAPNSHLEGYRGCLEPVVGFQHFLAWFKRYSYEAQKETASGTPSPHQPRQVLAAVVNAVDQVLEPSGWGNLNWDFAEDEPTAEHAKHGQLRVARLSDGIRTMIGLVAEAAHRAARLNRFLGAEACAKTPGIILIDEVDMHLHPEWQQLVLDGLQRAFPLVQFIVTTHSPQVLTTVPKKNIRLLKQDDEDNWSAQMPDFSPLAKESGDALAYLMEVHAVPETEVGDWVQRYETLVRSGAHDSPEASQLLAKLESAGYEFTQVDKHRHEVLIQRSRDRAVKPHD